MLKLKTLKLKHFMCVTDASLDFTNESVILLVGDNGNGKSSVLDAIALCFLEAKKADSYKDFIQSGFLTSNIELDAEIKGKPIHFNVQLNMKNATPMERKVLYDGKEYTNSEVTDLLETFELSYFSSIIMSMQGEDDITKQGPAQREKYLQKLLNFDFSEQLKICDEKLGATSEKIKFNKNAIEFNEKTIESRQNEIKPTVDTEPLLKQADALTKECSEYNSKLSEVQSITKERDELTTKKHTLEVDITNAKSTISQAEYKKTALVNSLNDSKKAVVELEDAKKNLENIKQKAASIKEEINNKLSEKTELTKKLHEKLSSKVAAEQNVAVAKHHVELCNGGVCPECGQHFDESDTEKYSKELEAASKELEVVTEEYDCINDELVGIDIFNRNKTAEMNEVTSEMYRLESAVSNLEKSIVSESDINSQIVDIDNEIMNATKTVENATNEVNDLTIKIELLGEKLTESNNLYVDLTSAQNKLNAINSKVAENNAILNNNVVINNSIIKLKEDVVKAKTEIETAMQEEVTYDTVYKLFSKTFPNYLVVKTCKKLENEINDFIHIIFPEMQVSLFANKKGVEFFYTPKRSTLKEFTKETMLNVKMASGFEKSALSLAFKVALCKAYNLPFAFFDEIDSAGSDNNSEKLFKSLIGNNLFEQLFIITHKTTVRDVINSIATKTKVYYVKNGIFKVDENV